MAWVFGGRLCNVSGNVLDLKTCPNCNQPFTNINKNQKHCSRVCAKEKARKLRSWPCVGCGENFYHKQGTEKTCSLDCFKDWKARKARIARGKRCLNCGDKFTAGKGRAEEAKFCGYECRDKAREKKEDVQCEWCEKTFRAKKCRGRRFCSLACRGAWQSSLPYSEWKGKLSDNKKNRARGKRNGMYGKAPHHPKPIEWTSKDGREIKFRSSWELTVAKYLDAMDIAWEFEPKRFKLKDKTYLPDFYLPEDDVYWEVKGWYNEKAKERTSEFRELHNDCNLVVITKPTYDMIDKQLRLLEA